MTERLSEHPVVLYVTFVLPIVLLILAVAFSAGLLLIMALLAWLGIAFIVLYIPIASDNGTSS